MFSQSSLQTTAFSLFGHKLYLLQLSMFSQSFIRHAGIYFHFVGKKPLKNRHIYQNINTGKNSVVL